MSAHDSPPAGTGAGAHSDVPDAHIDPRNGPGIQPRIGPRIGPTTRLECRICWQVYDPALGDPVWQVAPGTPFTELPPHWSCPNCAGEKTGFLVLEDE